MQKRIRELTTALMVALVSTSMVQAQSFGIFFGDEPSDFEQEYAICLSDNQIRRTVASLGYSDISLNVPNDKHVQVRATREGWVYLLDFNFCTGRVEGRERLRAAN